MDHGQPHTVKRLRLRDPQPSNSNNTSVLDVYLDNGRVVSLQNNAFIQDNPALMVLAYLGVSPSTMDEAEGKTLPLTLTNSGQWVVPSSIMQSGKHALQTSAWGPQS